MFFKLTFYHLFQAAGQLVGVSGRDYRVYFYHTYLNQLSKNNKKNGNNHGNNGAKSTENVPSLQSPVTQDSEAKPTAANGQNNSANSNGVDKRKLSKVASPKEAASPKNARSSPSASPSSVEEGQESPKKKDSKKIKIE